MPENQNVEWKAKWKDEYLGWICGFATATSARVSPAKAGLFSRLQVLLHIESIFCLPCSFKVKISHRKQIIPFLLSNISVILSKLQVF